MEFGSDGEGGENEKWYENDLLLAAELGKTLLERNKDLENQLIQTQQINHEQALENEFLIKQLEALREVNETRMKIYEELDRNSHEVEKTNKRLLEESRTDKQRIQRLCDTVESVEQRCSELQEKLDDYKEKDRVKLKKERQKTLSVPSLLEANGNYYKMDRMTAEQFLNWKNPFESQLSDTTDTIRNLRAQQAVEKRRKRNLEQDMAELINENQQLTLKTEDLEEKLDFLKQHLETELNESEIRHSKVCKVCRSKINIEADTAFATEIENDTVDIRSSCQLVRLRNGGSAYGSMETISKVANENRDNVEGQVPVNSGGVSLLSELDAQYRTLVEKYECLLRAKSKKISYAGTHPETPYITPVTTPAATPDVEYYKPLSSSEVKINKGVQVGSPSSRPRSFDLSVSSDPTSGHFDHSPEYKKLFKEIFETLKRSVIQEEAAAQI